MAENQIEIEVELTGADKVEKSMKGLEEGLEGIGETGSRLVKVMGSTNEQLGEGLENVAGSVGEVREAFTQLGGSIKNLGTSGMSGILSLIGPLGLLVGAGVAVYETFRQITGAAQEAEEAQEAMAAAAGDLQGRLESLAESGVILATEEMEKFSMAVLESQFVKERIQKAQEKFGKNFQLIREQQQALRKATEELTFAERVFGKEHRETAKAQEEVTKAQYALEDARFVARRNMQSFNKELRSYLETTRAVAEQEKKLEEQSTEGLKTEAKRLAGILKENEELRFRNELKKDEIQLNEMLAEVQVQNLELTKAIEDGNREQIQQILKGSQEQTKGIDEITNAERKAAQERDKIREDQRKKRQEDFKKRQEDIKRQADQQRREQERLAKEAEANRRREILLDSQLRTLTIQETQSGMDQMIALEKEKHQTVLALTKDGSKERLIEEKRFRMALNQIILDNTKQQQEEEIALRYEFAERLKEIEGAEQTLFGTDIEALNAESQQRLDLLKLQFDKEVELARVRGEDLTAIQKRYSLERLAIEKETVQQQSDILAGYFDQYGQGFAEAAVGALLFGENFQEATSQILLGLAEQAGVRSIMSFAEGFAQLALGDPRAAASFKAGALFAGAAVIAGASGKGLAEGGGGTTPTATPTGTPTTAPTPQREEVRQEGMVFNINFGGAVVYDTKKAAEQALADRLVTIMNTSRRGSPRIGR